MFYPFYNGIPESTLKLKKMTQKLSDSMFLNFMTISFIVIFLKLFREELLLFPF